MEKLFINQMEKNTEVIDFFLVKSISIRTDKNGKAYLDVVLSDKTGDINGKKWGIDGEEPALSLISETDIVKVKAAVSEYNGQKQLSIQRIRKLAPDDDIQMMDFVKAAPEMPEDMYNYIHGEAEAIADEDLRKVALKLLDDNREKLMYYPAAQKNHHAELGGLLYHMKRMLMTGKHICEVYKMLDVDLVVTGVIIHDMEKINEIESNELGISPGYSFEGKLLGHIVQGVKAMDKLCEELGVPYEKAIMLEHMILAHHYEPEFGSPKRPMFPEAEVLHYLDILDARLFDMEDALNGIEPGTFSEKVFTLDNRQIYKREDK